MCLLSGDRCICTDIRIAGAHSSNAIDIPAAALPRGQRASCAIRESRGTMPQQSHPRWTVPCKISSAPHPRQQDQQAEYVETVPMLLKAHTRIQKYRPIRLNLGFANCCLEAKAIPKPLPKKLSISEVTRPQAMPGQCQGLSLFTSSSLQRFEVQSLNSLMLRRPLWLSLSMWKSSRYSLRPDSGPWNILVDLRVSNRPHFLSCACREQLSLPCISACHRSVQYVKLYRVTYARPFLPGTLVY